MYRKILNYIWNWMEKIEQKKLIRAVRRGLILMIPVLIIGSASLILMSFPFTPYLEWIKQAGGGFIYDILSAVYNATFGILALVITLTVSESYAELNRKELRFIYILPLTSLVCFMILSGDLGNAEYVSHFGAKGMFTGIFSACVSAKAYIYLDKKIYSKGKAYTEGIDYEFAEVIRAVFPAAIVIMLFAVFNYVIRMVFHVGSFQEFYINALNRIFRPLGCSFAGGLIFIMAISVFWFFGIHGSDVLEGISEQLFQAADAQNLLSVSMGQAPQQILTKTFLDSFVLMGGCGATLCLLIALYLFGRRRSDRQLSEMATIPMLFNINEMMVFGLPIVFNPIFLIPFLITPAILFMVSYAAVRTGLVPMTVAKVEWTTPVILGGYIATGSVKGSLLQLVNLCIGAAVYTPFVKLYDRERERNSVHAYEEMQELLKKDEQSYNKIVFTELGGNCGNIAKGLVTDLKRAMEEKKIDLYYQPQFSTDGKCFGVEALLRWHHKTFGTVYPPLMLKLATESGILTQLEQYVIRHVFADSEKLCHMVPDIRISINVTGRTLQQKDFSKYLEEMRKEYKVSAKNLCIEITEQDALLLTDETERVIEGLRSSGYLLAIDDFSMGHTSLKYLQNNHFDIVKLDGALVRDVEHNPRSSEIISSIVKLSKSLSFMVLAEYVETKNMTDRLHELGCDCYQGYYFSRAVPLEEVNMRLKH